jgi:hypothetical protein
MQGHSLAQQEKDKRTSATQAKNQAAANYRLEVGTHAQAITDPVQRAQFIDNAEQSGVLAGLLKPGDLSGMRDVPPGQQAQARLKELVDHLTTLDKNGYNLDELSQAGATIKLNDGSTVPVSTALDLTRERPISATGSPIAKPPMAGKTAEERFLAKWAKDRNKTVDTLTAAEELQAKTDYSNAGKTPAGDDYSRFLDKWAREHNKKSAADLTTAEELDAKKAYGNAGRNPQLDEINLALKQLQLQNEKQKATPVDIQPGSKEYKIADDLATGKLTFAEFRSLYSYSRDVNAKTSIYMKASEINPNFNPAMYEMGYKFASNPKTQNQMASINNVLSGVPDLLKVSDAAARSGVTILNSFINPAGYALGGKRYSNLKIARTAFADELSGALGYGSATDMSREMGFDMTDPNLSPENFKSALQDVVIPFVNRKKTSLLGPMGIYGTEGMNPSAQTPKTGTTTTTSAPKDGQEGSVNGKAAVWKQNGPQGPGWYAK